MDEKQASIRAQEQAFLIRARRALAPRFVGATGKEKIEEEVKAIRAQRIERWKSPKTKTFLPCNDN
ncbi:hypothetical protein K2Q00_02655 [Patescibacteria group bacterium]|nr:hypothetical protein [Patescibacteria group bacterium]